MMLNTDYEIFFDLELDSTGRTSCKLEPGCVETGTCGTKNICPKADTYEQGQDYIEVNITRLVILSFKVALFLFRCSFLFEEKEYYNFSFSK